jgi:serine/threonine-protein kinase
MSGEPGRSAHPIDDEAVTGLGHQRPEIDPWLGREIEGRYRIERKLGAGGMGRVYLGAHLRTGAALAIKIVETHPARSQELHKRCFNEARAMMEVRSSHVAHAIDVGALADGELYLVMEYLQGEDLEVLLRREGALPWSRLGPMALQLCSGLGSAHRKGIIHRDIKPSNCFRICVDDNPDHIKIIDFGIARDVDASTGPTQKGTVIGTPEYLAPELVTGDSRAGIRSDIYALGAMLYKLLTGIAPFRGESAFEVLGKHVLADRVPPSRAAPHLEIEPSVDALILRTLAQNPAERFATTEELAQAIRATLGLTRAGTSLSAVAAVPANVVSAPASTPPSAGHAATSEIMPTRAVAVRAVTLLSTIAAFVVATELVAPHESRSAEMLVASAPASPRARATEPSVRAPAPVNAEQVVRPVEATAKVEPAPVRVAAPPPVEVAEASAPASEPPTPEPGPPAPELPPPTSEQSPPVPEPVPPRPKAKPEPDFPYAAARSEVAQQLKFLRTTCMMTGGLITPKVKFRVDVAANGAASVRVYSGDRELRACFRKALSVRFERSPRGGAFVYTLTHSSADFAPVPLEAGKESGP